MKPIKFVAGVLVLLMCVSGCETVQRKFTRKPKAKDAERPVLYFEDGPYQKKYSNAYYYKTHYTQWKSWHSEIIKELDGNHKRLSMAAEEAVNHLQEMKRNLVPEKQTELQVYLDSLTKIAARMNNESFSDTQASGVRTELEFIQRRVEGEFNFRKVESFIIPDKVEV